MIFTHCSIISRSFLLPVNNKLVLASGLSPQTALRHYGPIKGISRWYLCIIEGSAAYDELNRNILINLARHDLRLHTSQLCKRLDNLEDTR